MKKTLIAIAAVIIASASIFLACSKDSETEEAKNCTSNIKEKCVNEEYIPIAFADNNSEEIIFNFDIDAFANNFNTILREYLGDSYIFDNIYIDDQPNDFEEEPIFAVSAFDIAEEATYTTFLFLKKEQTEDGTIIYFMDKNKPDGGRKITCKGTNCKNDKGCSYDREKNDCTECVGGTCEKTDAPDTGGLRAKDWIGWGVAIVVAIIALCK